MIKTITVTQFKREALPPKSEHQQIWRYVWQIKDEKQRFRQISAHIFFNTLQQTSSFQADHVREMPLVDALIRQPVGAIFTIDFTDFNHRHCYDSRAPYKLGVEAPAEHDILFPTREGSHYFQVEVQGFV
ncbi:hypothetical protein [Thiofilum flexile]|uniref:hypothetical protein n=1 Tax=Thiofilum flexile TaxID=125627 RepID=UPI00036A6D6D|nr:hypothetical protein [Thiofilum flexile]